MINGVDLEDKNNEEELKKIAKDYKLKIGFYVQEPVVGTKGVQSLIKKVNDNKQFFKFGLALGNSRDGRSPCMIKSLGGGIIDKALLTNGILSKIQRVFDGIFLFFRYIFSFCCKKKAQSFNKKRNITIGKLTQVN